MVIILYINRWLYFNIQRCNNQEKEDICMNNNIYVLGVDMEERSVEEIARDAANQIAELFDRLVAEQEQEKII